MRKQQELSRLAGEWITAYESGDSFELERIVLRSEQLAVEPYEGHTSPPRITAEGRRRTEEIDQQLREVADSLAASLSDVELSEAIVDRVRRMRDCERRVEALELATALARPTTVRGSRCRQFPVDSVHASHAYPGGEEYVERGRFGAAYHADGYVFGMVIRPRMRVRGGKRKRILMVVA